MEPESRTDPLARERARKRRAQQIQRRRLVLAACLLGLIVLIVGLAVGLSGPDEQTVATGIGENEGTTIDGDIPDDGETVDQTSTTELTSTVFTATLTGDQSVPPVETLATATLVLQYDADEETLSYVVDVTSMITNPSSAIIYEGAPGESGAAIVTLFGGPTEEGEWTGELAEGFVEEEDLTGSLIGATIPDLVTLLASGDTYVSIGNKSHPVDAIRGQID